MLLALAVIALAIRYLVIGIPSSSAGLPRLAGKTSQDANAHLTLSDDGRVLGFRTRIAGTCTDNQTWSTGWLAAERRGLRFSRAGRNFVARAHYEWRPSHGEIARLALTLRGTLTGRDAAQGTVRMVTRVYFDERENLACDSRDVAWAVGHNAAGQLRHVALGRVVGYYYPTVPSLAGPVDAKRKRFIARADAICSTLIAHARGSSDRRVYVRVSKALRRLGGPPTDRADYRSWLEELQRDLDYDVQADGWYDANYFAQRFGLTRCSSYGDRTPVPILSDGHPRPLT